MQPAASAGADLPRRDQQREVPGDDLPAHADRLLAACNRTSSGVRGGHDAALDLRRPAREVPEVGDGLRDVDELGQLDRLAVVERVDLGQLVRVGRRSGRRGGAGRARAAAPASRASPTRPRTPRARRRRRGPRRPPRRRARRRRPARWSTAPSRRPRPPSRRGPPRRRRSAGQVPPAHRRGPRGAHGRDRRADRPREVGMPMRLSQHDPGRPARPTTFGRLRRSSLDDFEFEEQVGNSLVVREPIGVVGVHHAVELPAAPDRGQGRARAGRRLHRRAQAERGRAAQRVHPRRDHRRGRPARRACSTWSPASARWSARRSPRTPTSTWCRSPARPAPASASRELGGRRRSSGSRSSSAASRPTSSSTTPTSSRRVAAGVSTAASSTPARPARRCTRMLVPARRLAEAEAIAAEAKAESHHASATRSTDGTRRSARWSRAAQRDRVRGYIQKGIDEGATLVTGGPEAPDGLDTGYFVQPTVFSDVTPDMTIAQEEIFGPVLSIMPYDDEDEAVAHRQRHDLRPRRRRVVRRRRAGQGASPAGCAPARSRSTAARSTCRRPSAATSSRATAASSARSASRSSWRSRPSSSSVGRRR